VACGLSPAFWVMVVARLAQGLAGGVLVPMAISAIFQAFPPDQRGAALGAFAIPIVAGPALGPTMGGYIVTYQDWRLIFFINLPIGVAAILLAAWLLHPGRADAHVRLDGAGVVLSTIGFGSVLYALSRVSADGWSSLTVRGLMVLGFCTLGVFIAYEIRQDDPLLDMRLFGIPQFLFANMVGWVSTVALFGAEFMLPLYLQNLRGLTALDTGILLLPQGLSIAIAGPIGGRLVDKIGARPVVLFGFLLLAFNTWQMAHLTLDTTFGELRWLLIVRGLALGFSLQPTQLVAMGAAPPRLRTNASSLNTAMRGVFQSFGVAMLSTVVQTQTAVHTTMLSWQVQPDNMQGAFLGAVVGKLQAAGLSAGAAQAAAVQAILGQVSRQGAVLGFADAYGITFIAALAAIAVAFLLPGRGQIHVDPSALAGG
jgi:MFS transporter, DHA2 family, multidrug resistance protein